MPQHDVIRLSTYFYTAPGVVSRFTTEIQLTSVFDWSPPQDPNGIIFAYEFTYRVNGSDTVTHNFTEENTRFNLNLVPSTVVSHISVRAYTSAGPGDTATIGDVLIPLTQTPTTMTTSEIPRE